MDGFVFKSVTLTRDVDSSKSVASIKAISACTESLTLKETKQDQIALACEGELNLRKLVLIEVKTKEALDLGKCKLKELEFWDTKY